VTKSYRLTPAMLIAVRASLRPGDRGRLMLPNGVAIEIVAGDGTAEPLQLPANQSEPEAAHEALVANLTAVLNERRNQRA
jgi:hypothetical protein